MDKTAFIHELISSPKGIYFLSRPRRFGKSLTISTLKAIFQGKRELFDGLKIDGMDYDWKSYPVIHLDMGDRRCNNAEALERSIRIIIEENAQNLGITLTEDRAQEAFRELIRKASNVAPVVILIDEYDKPILDNIGKPEVGAIREELEAFYGVIKTTEPCQRFVFITGVAKFTRVSIFSKLNHLTDITMNGRFATMFGYTQYELETNFAEHLTDAAQKRDVSRQELIAQMRRWYNGYRFEESAETVYNPVSVAQFFFNDGKFNNYWFETGSPGILFELSKKWNFDFEDALTQPIQDLAFSQFDVDRLLPLPLLMQTGYLTIKEAVSDPFMGAAYYLGFPNFEVASAFTMFLLRDYLPEADPFTSVQRLRKTLFSGDHEGFIAELNSLLGAIPWRLHIKHESYYHTITYMAMRLVGLSASAEEPVHSGAIDSGVTVGETVYLFEFKLDKSANYAIEQIKNKRYAAKYSASGKTVILFGVNFNSEKRQIDDWRAERSCCKG
ncbi:MAG: ATP-binding protein [Oscillospiraceae bacterium]|nr:ATP-binding protein [Oscillospiraceae bacterium]